jgi:hypothetical protein
MIDQFGAALDQDRAILRFGEEFPHLVRSALILHTQELDRR